MLNESGGLFARGVADGIPGSRCSSSDISVYHGGEVQTMYSAPIEI